MKSFPSKLNGLYNIKKCTFPQCPHCRQKKLKELVQADKSVKILCIFCGFSYMRGNEWVPNENR